jgi:ribosomal protein S24E
MEITQDTKNNLLKRREIQFILESESNPGFEKSRKSVAEKLKTSEENVAIKYIRNNFGSREFLVEAFVYDNKEDKERIEPKKKEKKTAGGSS